MAAKPLPPASELRKLLRLDAEEGKLYWRRRPLEYFPSQRACSTWNTQHAGQKAGAVGKNGYVFLSVRNRRMYAHRVIWKMHYGRDPVGSIDHINRDRLDNRIANLREGTHAQNMLNVPKQKGASSQYFGVYKSSNAPGWCAQISINCKTTYIGYFQSEVDAAIAYDAVARENHGEWARLNFP